jgi:hypothetical protein
MVVLWLKGIKVAAEGVEERLLLWRRLDAILLRRLRRRGRLLRGRVCEALHLRRRNGNEVHMGIASLRRRDMLRLVGRYLLHRCIGRIEDRLWILIGSIA